MDITKNFLETVSGTGKDQFPKKDFTELVTEQVDLLEYHMLLCCCFIFVWFFDDESSPGQNLCGQVRWSLGFQGVLYVDDGPHMLTVELLKNLKLSLQYNCKCISLICSLTLALLYLYWVTTKRKFDVH